jgi:glycosyltransferase involved in cell wall biosynthesis
MITAFERLCCKAVDHVIAVDEFIAAKFTDWGVPTTVVRNAAWKENPLDEVGSVASAEPLATELAEKFVFVYLGAVTRQVAARECVQAMSEVQDVQPKSVLLFVGGFADATYEQEVLEEIRLRGLKYSVIILDQIPYSRVFSVLSCAHVGLILYSAENNYRDRVIFPHKLCDYCRAGLPMLVSNFDGLVRVTGDFGMGIAVDPTDPAAIARGMLAFAQNPGLTAAMSAASCAFFTDHLNWEAEQRKLMTIYNQLASSAERQRGRCSWLPIPTRRESEHGNQ